MMYTKKQEFKHLSTSYMRGKYYVTMQYGEQVETSSDVCVNTAARKAAKHVLLLHKLEMKKAKPIISTNSHGLWTYSFRPKGHGVVFGYGSTPEAAYESYLNNVYYIDDWINRMVERPDLERMGTIKLAEAPQKFWSRLLNIFK